MTTLLKIANHAGPVHLRILKVVAQLIMECSSFINFLTTSFHVDRQMASSILNKNKLSTSN